VKILKICLLSLFLVTTSQAQLKNFLTCITLSDSGECILGSPVSTTPVWDMLRDHAVITDSIIASLQDYGQVIDNYTAVATAVTDAKAKGGILIFPRTSPDFADSSYTRGATDSIFVWDFRNDSLKLHAPVFILQDTSTSRPVFEIRSSTALGTGGELNFFLNPSSAGNGDAIANISWYGLDAGGNKTLYSQIIGRSATTTDTDEAGDLEIYAMFDGTSTPFITLDGRVSVATQAALVINENGSDIDFRVEDSNGLEAIFMDAADGGVLIGNAPTGSSQGAGTLNVDSGVYVDGVLVTTSNDTMTYSSSTSGRPVIFIENTNDDANSARISFVKNPATAGDNDNAGEIVFYNDDSGGDQQVYSLIRGRSEDVSTGDHAGSLLFYAWMDSAEKEILRLDGFSGVVGEGAVVINDAGENIDFRIEDVNNLNSIFIDGADGGVLIGNAPTGTSQGAGTLNIDVALYTDGELVAKDSTVFADSLNLQDGQLTYSFVDTALTINRNTTSQIFPLKIDNAGNGNIGIEIEQGSTSYAIANHTTNDYLMIGRTGAVATGANMALTLTGTSPPSVGINNSTPDTAVPLHLKGQMRFEETGVGTDDWTVGTTTSGVFEWQNDGTPKILFHDTIDSVDVVGMVIADSALGVNNTAGSVKFIGIQNNTYASNQHEMWVNTSLDTLFIRQTGNAFFVELADLGGTH
jgi:hypothetical protein